MDVRQFEWSLRLMLNGTDDASVRALVLEATYRAVRDNHDEGAGDGAAHADPDGQEWWSSLDAVGSLIAEHRDHIASRASQPAGSSVSAEEGS